MVKNIYEKEVCEKYVHRYNYCTSKVLLGTRSAKRRVIRNRPEVSSYFSLLIFHKARLSLECAPSMFTTVIQPMLDGSYQRQEIYQQGRTTQLFLVPRVLWLFGQQMGARRDSEVLEFYYRSISAVKLCKPLRGSQSKQFDFFEFSRGSPGALPLTKEPEDSGYEIGFNE